MPWEIVCICAIMALILRRKISQTVPSSFKKSLPHVQQALTSGEMTIEGIHPPPLHPASMQNLVPTTPTNVPHVQQASISGEMMIKGFHLPPVPAYMQNLVLTTQKSLPHVQQALTSGEMTIEGIHPPPVPAYMQNLVPTTPTIVPHVPSISGEMMIKGFHPPPVPAYMQNLVLTTQSFLPLRNESQVDSPPVRNVQSSDSIPVPADNGAQPSALMSQPKCQEMRQDVTSVTSDIEMAKAIAIYLENKVGPKAIKKTFSPPEVAQVMHIRDFKNDIAMNKKLNYKLKRLCKDNCSNLMEYKQLYRDAKNCIKKKRKNIDRQIATVNNFRVELKTVWAFNGCASYLPADQGPSAIASKDAFDMSSLDECLPGDNDAQKKVKKIVKDYLSYEEKQKHVFRRSEILRMLVARASKQNKEISVSSKQSITRMLKKVYGDEKNVRIFSFRSLLENGKEVDGKRPLKEMDKKGLRLGKEKIVLVKSPCTRNDKTKNNKLTDKNASDLNSKPANLRNPERLFNRDLRDDERHESASLRKQDIQESISLCRQLSRLKITNSKRAGISEDISESEIQKTYKDQNKDKQGKATITVRKKQVVENLRKEHPSHKAKTNTDRCAEDKDGVRTLYVTYDKKNKVMIVKSKNNKLEPILPSLNASMRNADQALAPGGSGSIFSSNPMTPTTTITPSADPIIGPILQKNELGELME